VHASFADDSRNASQTLISGINAIRNASDVDCRSRHYVAFYGHFYDYLIQKSLRLVTRHTRAAFHRFVNNIRNDGICSPV